jgi:uncharacterized protein
MPQQTNAPAGPRHHSLSAEQFTALARGGGDPDTIAQLVAAQRSKHMILLSKVAELARSGERPDDALGVTGYQLLAQVQRQDPAAAAEVISYPSVGAWALRVIRANASPPTGGTALPDGNAALPGAQPSGLAAIAAAATIRAGLDAEIEVPVLGTSVLLPSLGAAEAVGDTAVVSTGLSGTGLSSTGEAEVRSGTRHERRRVRVGPGSPGWWELRRAEAGSLTVLIDDLDPFGMPAPDGEPTGRLTPAQAAEFRAMLRAAWPILSPARDTQSAAIIRVIVPYRASELGHISITSSQVFGAVAMSRQPGAYTCAETLVHETQHLKLYALLDLVTLTWPDDGQRYYAPWRRDPRPASGLLQGAYAFMGVSGFWRDQRHTAPEPEIRHRSHVEFARWRENAAAVAGTLLRSGQLTSAGVTFVETMAEVLGEWRREPVPGDALARARRDSDRHLDQWQADNGPVPRSHANGTTG